MALRSSYSLFLDMGRFFTWRLRLKRSTFCLLLKKERQVVSAFIIIN